MELDPSKIGFDLLYHQKLYLVSMNASLGSAALDGIINFLDYVLDTAEEQGHFTYPETEEENYEQSF